MSKFIHLHMHGSGSLLDGMCTEKKLAKRCQELGMDAIAITEHGNTLSLIGYYLTMRKAGIKPILGCEFYICPDLHLKDSDQKMNHLVVLAKDLTGYRNLLRLSSIAFLEGFYYKPRIDFETLCKYKEGLIVLSACLAGEVPRALLESRVIQEEISKKHKDKVTGETKKIIEQEKIKELLLFEERYQNALNIARKYRDVFGEDYYIEVQNHGIPEQIETNPHLISIAKELGIKIVATNDCHYIRKEDAKAHNILMEIQGLGGRLEGFDKYPEFYVKSYEEMLELFPEEYLATSVEIANKCNVVIDELEVGKEHQYYFPEYDLPIGETSESFMWKLCLEGFKYKITPYRVPHEKILEYQKRLEYEFEVIKTMGFCSYFIILWDIIEFCKRKDIPVGVARGSAGGSLVAFLMGITKLDPIRYDLLFERFLNPARISMPDIDVDFCYDRIGEVLDYVENKYGKEFVCKIGTFGTLATKAVLKDVARALGYDYEKINDFTKNMPNSFEDEDEDEAVKLTVESAVKRIPEFKKAVTEDKLLAEVVDIAKDLQGLNRHVSKHAAGVVIAPHDKPLFNYVALRSDPDGTNITAQGDMKDLEKLGFVKMDLLRLRTLTVIKNCLEMIKENQGLTVDLDMLSLDDVTTMRNLQEGNSMGVFQFESDGMRKLLKSMKPERFEDLIALNALYRPGPLNFYDEETGLSMVEIYVARKNGEMSIEYLHPVLEPILNETYGVIVYQEQCMKIAVDMAGYSLSEADELRKVMGKKLADLMPLHKEKFIKGAVAKGIDESIATTVFEQIETFAEYGFNKSHSTAYAIIAFQSAFLKTHFPVEFMCALLTSVMGNNKKFPKYLKETKRMEIPILVPDVRKSEEVFTVEGNGIRFGLFGIKGVGKTAIQAIKSLRNNHDIKDFLSFYLTVDSRVVNKTVLTSLIQAGAFDFLGHTRTSLISGLEEMQKIHGKVKAKISSNKKRKKPVEDVSVFYEPLYEVELPDLPEYPLREMIDKEKELTGLYLSADPLKICKKVLEKYADTTSKQLKEKGDGTTVFMGGLVTNLKEALIKKGKSRGKKMGMATVTDFEGTFRVTLFPDIHAKYKLAMYSGNVVIIRGTTSDYKGSIQINAVEVTLVDLDEAREMTEEKQVSSPSQEVLILYVNDFEDVVKVANEITLKLKSTGKSKLIIATNKDGEELYIELPICVSISEKVISQINQVDNVLNTWVETMW